jgi:hypothetical protein
MKLQFALSKTCYFYVIVFYFSVVVNDSHLEGLKHCLLCVCSYLQLLPSKSNYTFAAPSTPETASRNLTCTVLRLDISIL